MNDLTGDELPSPRADPEIIRKEESTFVPRVKVPGGLGKVNFQRRGPDWSPTGWSPNGRRIIFTDDCCQFGSNFWTVRPHGTGLRQRTHFGPAPLRAGFASYSPDGRRIVLQYNGNTRCAESAPSPDGSGVAIPSSEEMRQSLPQMYQKHGIH